MKITNKWVRRFIYYDGHEPINPLFYLFMMMTVAWVIAIVFFSDASSVHASSLFFALNEVSPVARQLWGWMGLALIAGTTATILFRRVWLSKLLAFLGVLLWLFASWSYILMGSWILMFAISVPNMLFWVWGYFETLRYEKDVLNKS